MELDDLGVLKGNLTRADVVEHLLQGATQLLRLCLDHLIRLHRPIVVAACSVDLVHTQAREELALPLTKPGMVLVDILIVPITCGQEALGTEGLHQGVQLAGGLGKIDLGLLSALAPVVRIAEAKDCVLDTAQGTRELSCTVTKLAPEAAAIAWELALTSSRDAENHKWLARQGAHIKRVEGAAAHSTGGVAAATALPRNCLGALLSMTCVGGVQDGHGLRRVRQALAQITSLGVGVSTSANGLLGN
mmetsp:Transcript_26431/g.71695  ORF Transcript_26431/g.71695 Transcript_26431/m.71695 type:complete len:247 (-) Transcript_26431:460-1200(-)